MAKSTKKERANLLGEGMAKKTAITIINRQNQINAAIEGAVNPKKTKKKEK